MQIKFLAFLFLLHIPLFCLSYSNSVNNSFSCDHENQITTHPDALLLQLSAEEYHDAALRGEFLNVKNDPDQFLTFSNLLPVAEKVGVSLGGRFRDLEGNEWIVKQGQNSINEYLGAQLMHLFIPSVPEVKLFNDKPGYTASKYSPNFRMQSLIKKRIKNANHKPIVGEFELNIAMDLLGLGDRNYANIGYIEEHDFLVATRVDFDNSFQHFDFNSPLDLKLYKTLEIYQNLHEAQIPIQQITNISDASIFHVLGNAYNDLLTVNPTFNPQHYQNLAPALIARKAQFLTLIKNHQPNAIAQDIQIPEPHNESNAILNIICEQNATSLNWLIHERRFDFLNLLIEHCFNNENSGTLLHWASFEGKSDIVQFLLENAVDPDLPGKHGDTPLHRAVKTNQYNVIQLLLQHHADLNAQDHQGHTPLHWAINEQQLQMVQLFLQNNADPNIQDNQGITPLHLAINKQNLQLVKSLLEYDADPNIPNNQNDTPFDWANEKGYTELIEELQPLHYAVKHHQLEAAELLLQKGINPNSQDKQGLTPLHWAIKNGDLQLIHLLLDYNAHPNIQGVDGATPLDWAAKFGHLEILLSLKDLVEPQGYNVTTLMHWAASNAQWNIVKHTLEHGADPNTEGKYGSTLLYWVIYYGHLDLLKFLLEEFHIDLNIENSFKFIPLHLAIEKNHPHLVKLLLQKDANPNLENQNGDTPLELAAHYSHLEIIEILIEYGLDIKQQIGSNSPLLHNLVWKNNMLVFKLLLEKGADPNAKDKHGYTVFDSVIVTGRSQAIQPLLDHNVDLTTKDKNGKTPYDKALNHQRFEMAELIEKKMAENNFLLSAWFFLKQLLK